MEELRETALAYYANLSENQKKEAMDFFRKMDADGNGYVSISEFKAFLPKALSDYTNRMFAVFDKDGNGTLDFEEVITCYYVFITGRIVFCDGCGDFLKGLYFTCCQCFQPRKNVTFDLCFTCYRERNFTHHKDAIFYDNFALLRSKKLKKNSGETLTVFEGLKLGMELGNAFGSCNIM